MNTLRAVLGFWIISRLVLGNFRIAKRPSHLETAGSFYNPEIAQKLPNCFVSPGALDVSLISTMDPSDDR